MMEHTDPYCVPKEQHDQLVAEALTVQMDATNARQEAEVQRKRALCMERALRDAEDRIHTLERYIADQSIKKWRKKL